MIQMVFTRLGDVEQRGLNLLHLSQTRMSRVFDVRNTDGQRITMVVAQSAVKLSLGELGRALEKPKENAHEPPNFTLITFILTFFKGRTSFWARNRVTSGLGEYTWPFLIMASSLEHSSMRAWYNSGSRSSSTPTRPRLPRRPRGLLGRGLGPTSAMIARSTGIEARESIYHMNGGSRNTHSLSQSVAFGRRAVKKAVYVDTAGEGQRGEVPARMGGKEGPFRIRASIGFDP